MSGLPLRATRMGWHLHFTVAIAVVVGMANASRAAEPEAAQTIKDLLPAPPNATTRTGPAISDNLADVPEMTLRAHRAKLLSFPEANDEMVQLFKGVRGLNAAKTDGFIVALRGNRPDLDNLPFAMGNACRATAGVARCFKNAAQNVRAAWVSANTLPIERRATRFWDHFESSCFEEDRKLADAGRAEREAVIMGRYAALWQVLAPESTEFQLGLVRYLSDAGNAAASRSLAILAIFSCEEPVRRAAIEALKDRPRSPSTDVLLKALRYPWPPIIERAASAAVQLGRRDLAPHLVDMLDEPDPREPIIRQVDGRKTVTVQEVVRVNHLRNCLLCHAPAERTTTDTVLTAPVPLLDVPPPSSEEYYRQGAPDLIVRVDVVYLRQDFSVMLPVEKASPEGKLQRFDFLVRQRALTEDEEAAYRKSLAAGDSGKPAPHRRAALDALRQLTGKDAPPNSSAWRETLQLQARAQ